MTNKDNAPARSQDERKLTSHTRTMNKNTTFITILSALVALLSSCDAVPIAPEPAYYPAKNQGDGAGEVPTPDGSGTRLRRYVYTSADGLHSERPARFYDTVLGAECAPVRTNHGFLCVPFSGVATTATNVFADASCKVPALYIDEKCDVPRYLHIASPGACGTVGNSVILEVDPVATQHAAWHMSKGSCEAIPVAELSGKAIHTIGNEPDYSIFQLIKLDVE